MMSRPPRVLAVLSGLYASTIVGIAKPLLRLHEMGEIDLDLSFQFLARRRQVDRADVLILCHSLDPDRAWILECARDAGTPLLYEMDDNLLEPPPDIAGMAYLRTPARRDALLRGLRQAVLVRTYAPALKRFLEAINPNVALVPGPVDWRLVPAEPARTDSGRIRIVYGTGRRSDSIGPMLIAPLRRALDEHSNLDLTIWGPRLRGLSGHPRVRHREHIADYDRYFSEFARAGFDIGLAPLPDDPFHRCKTNIKFREYAACRIAGIYSDTEVYRDGVTDGVTGLLVPAHEEAWVGALRRLIGDAALRLRIQQEAHAFARCHYPPGQMERDWLAHIHGAAGARTPGALRHGPLNPVRGGGARPSAGPLAMGAALFSQGLRYASRVPALLRSGGLKDVWARTRGQLAAFRQLMAWELTLWRVQRHRSRMP